MERDEVLWLAIEASTDCHISLLPVFMQVFMPDCLGDKPYVSHE